MNRSELFMPWYWILIILSAIVGPFEAMYALNKARQNRKKREEKEESLHQAGTRDRTP